MLSAIFGVTAPVERAATVDEKTRQRDWLAFVAIQTWVGSE
jgi:hypothetical protein